MNVYEANRSISSENFLKNCDEPIQILFLSASCLMQLVKVFEQKFSLDFLKRMLSCMNKHNLW